MPSLTHSVSHQQPQGRALGSSPALKLVLGVGEITPVFLWHYIYLTFLCLIFGAQTQKELNVGSATFLNKQHDTESSSNHRFFEQVTLIGYFLHRKAIKLYFI